MERKITVLVNKGATVVINSTATTLGELKAEMDAAGVTYGGMSIFEGISKTELLDDASILPSNLPYKGQVTNDLVILLSVKDKKITSGAAVARAEVYAMIKNLGLEQEVIETFGRNFTQVSTSDLMVLIASKQSTTDAEVPANESEGIAIDPDGLVNGFAKLVEVLYETGVIDEVDRNEIMDIFEGRAGYIPEGEPKIESPYSQEEQDEMFNFLGK